MEERQISVDGTTHALPVPFMTLATQNPIETYGTYHLPEAQLDRFLMRLSIGYPDRAAEMAMLDIMPQSSEVSAVMSLEELLALRGAAKQVTVAENVKAYILSIVAATRADAHRIRLGASPRASIALYKASQAMALMNDRSYATPDDVKAVAVSVLSHRIILASGQTEYASAEQMIARIVADAIVPL
jgi:MoxR-like ATPase